MKKFDLPMVEVIAFSCEDIITTSGGTGAGPNVGGMGDEEE